MCRVREFRIGDHMRKRKDKKKKINLFVSKEK